MTARDITKYAAAFAITALIFATAIGASNYLNDTRLNELKTAEDKISIGILSSETEFTLLGEAPCKSDPAGGTLSGELNSLGDKLNYSENIGARESDIESLKKYYSLLEIKDFLLTKKTSELCGKDGSAPIPILYFYVNSACTDCTREGYVLTYLREKYPRVRVYTFDYNLGLSAVKTLISLYDVQPQMPAVVVRGKTYAGFKSIGDMLDLLPELGAATSTEAAPAAPRSGSH